MLIRTPTMLIAVLLSLAACQPGNLTEGGGKVRLSAIERSATSLKLQWDAVSAANDYTVDFFTGPGYTTCDFPQNHNDVAHVTGTTATISNLLPSTLYQIHVHDLPGYRESTNLILISTLPAGAGAQPVTTSDYTICGN